MNRLRDLLFVSCCAGVFLALALGPVAAQTITFSGVPSNVTVQCLGSVPGGLLSAVGAIPFGVMTNTFGGVAIGGLFTISRQSAVGINFGKLELCPSDDWSDAMVNGASCKVSVGDSIATIVGNAGIPEPFLSRLAVNPIVIMPVVTFPVSSGNATIQGFIIAQLISVEGSGNWSVTLELLSAPNSTVTASSGGCGSTGNLIYTETQSSPTTNCNNIITRVWSVTNYCGSLSASATQTITIANTTPPTMSCPATVTTNVGAGQCTAANVSLGTAIASANCYGAVAINNNAPSVFAKGTNAVVWTATDGCGNSTTGTQQVIVVDLQPPIISCPGNIVMNPTIAGGAIVTFAPTATDNCDGSVPVLCTPASGSTFPVGTTTVNCSALDSSLNSATCSFNVTVANDTIFRITSVQAITNDVRVAWMMPPGLTGIVQATAAGVYSNSFSDLSLPIFIPGNLSVVTNYTDLGGATNFPSRYYRVRLAP